MSKRWRLPTGAKIWAVKDSCTNCCGDGFTTEYPGNEKTEVWCNCLEEYVIGPSGAPRPAYTPAELGFECSCGSSRCNGCKPEDDFPNV